MAVTEKAVNPFNLINELTINSLETIITRAEEYQETRVNNKLHVTPNSRLRSGFHYRMCESFFKEARDKCSYELSTGELCGKPSGQYLIDPLILQWVGYQATPKARVPSPLTFPDQAQAVHVCLLLSGDCYAGELESVLIHFCCETLRQNSKLEEKGLVWFRSPGYCLSMSGS